VTNATDGPVETGGQEDRILPWDQVREIAGISRATAWRMQQTGDFPRPVQVSPNRVGWWESELTAWKAERREGGRFKPLRSPRAPRLIETGRSAKPGPKPVAAPAQPPPGPPTSTTAPRVVAPEQALLPLETAEPATRVRARRQKRAVSPDQIDFGF
jgi:prophage regulatory protein